MRNSKLLYSVAALIGFVSSTHSALALPTLLQLGLRPIHVAPAPLAYPVGEGTAVLSGMIEGGLQTVIRNSNSDLDAYSAARLTLEYAQKQSNGSIIGGSITGDVTYSGLATDDVETEVEGLVYISSPRGTLSAGYITAFENSLSAGVLNTGHADLSYNLFLVDFSNPGLAYVFRTSSFNYQIAADRDGDVTAGVSYESPFGQLNYLASVDVYQGEVDYVHSAKNFVAGTALRSHNWGIKGAAKFQYGSAFFGFGLGYENVDPKIGTISSDRRYFGSVGANYKIGALKLSVAAALAEFSETDVQQLSIATGLQYHFGQGLSLNAGYNYIDTNETNSTGAVEVGDRQEVLVTLRAEF